MPMAHIMTLANFLLAYVSRLCYDRTFDIKVLRFSLVMFVDSYLNVLSICFFRFYSYHLSGGRSMLSIASLVI